MKYSKGNRWYTVGGIACCFFFLFWFLRFEKPCLFTAPKERSIYRILEILLLMNREQTEILKVLLEKAIKDTQ